MIGKVMNKIKQLMDSIWQKSFSNERAFTEIIGHDNIKMILNRAKLSKKPCHVLLVGKPGSAKTMFLTELMRSVNQSYFTVGSNTTKAGLLNQLFEKRPKYLLVDELEKMSKVDQVSLLHLMETGIISETKMKKTRHIELTSWVFATANSCEKIVEPLLSRFVILQIPEYTFEEFTNIAISRLAKEKVNRDIATIIAEKVWTVFDSKDIRDVIKVARLVSNKEDISPVIGIMKHYIKLDKKGCRICNS